MDGEDPSPKNCHLNEENIKELVEVLERLKNNEYKHQDDENINEKKSRFIISPNNYWNLQRNNLLQLIFVIYILIFPTVVVNNEFISPA